MAQMAIVFAAAAAAKMVGSILEGQAAGAAHDANSRIAEQNRDIALNQAASRELSSRRRSAFALGGHFAGIAESGVDPGFGSATNSLRTSAARAELDALNIRHEGAMHAFGFERERVMERAAGKQSRRMGHVNAVLQGVSSAASFFSGGTSPQYQNVPQMTTRPSTMPSYGGSGEDSINDRWGW